MQLGPYECTISSDDVELPEFAVEEDVENGVVTCWVPSKEGRPFKLDCSYGGTLDERNAMRLMLTADGEVLDTRIAVNTESSTLSGLRLDSWTIRPYLFKPHVKPTEDFDEDEMDTEELDDPYWKERGVITLEMTRVEALRFEPLADDEPSSPLPTADRLRTIEVGQKDVSPKKITRRTVSWNWGADEGYPIATFRFKHRPKEWLEAYGFMPRDLANTIDFDALALNGQPEYLRSLKQLTLQDEVMS